LFWRQKTELDTLMTQPIPKTYFNLLKLGAFPGRIDPWAEQARYFQQIHSGMIGDFLRQMSDSLLELGYVAGRETSLLITDRSEPDIFIRQREDVVPPQAPRPDYSAAAVAVLAEPGVVVIEMPDVDQDAIFIRDFATSRLVTVIEIVSPRNKTAPAEMQQYVSRRLNLRSERVNIVEIDLTRSYTRLLTDKLVTAYPYHVAVYPSQDKLRIIGIEFEQALKRIAIPLRTEVLPLELQQAYDDAYQTASIPAQLLSEHRYTASDLPFPTTLTESQRHAIEKILTDWQQALHQERPKSS
jgi:uncharacterized protein YuzE